MSSKQYFEKVADNWDEMRKSFFPESIRSKAIRAAEVNDGLIVADIGAGSGYITEGLLELNIKIIAVDQSEKMLDVMKQKFREHNNIDYRSGESENLPIMDNEADIAFANMYLHHVENPLISIKEGYRVLKKGGKLVITDLDKHNHDFLIKEQHDRWQGFERSDILSWFKESGFKNIKIDCIGDNCCAESELNSESAKINVFIAIGQK